METREIVVTATIHRRERAESGQARRRTSLRKWIVRLNGWTVAWCLLHRRMMNIVYIRRRGCVMRRCKHLNWLEGGEKDKNGH